MCSAESVAMWRKKEFYWNGLGCCEQEHMLERIRGAISLLNTFGSVIVRVSSGSWLYRCMDALMGESLCRDVRVVGSW